MRKNEFIKQMNLAGKTKTPVLFIVDFEQKNYLLIKIPDGNTSGIFFNINGIKNYKPANHKPGSILFDKSPVGFAAYRKAFSRVKKEINAGNTFLVNLTFPTPVKTNLELKEIFHFSRAKYKLIYKNKFVVFSPESFVRINKGKIYSFPMKGTIDASIPGASEIILNDEKEKAEHNTIVDLIRNDLSIVSKKVKVEKFRYIEKIKTNQKELLQVSSKISGILDGNYAENIGEIITSLLPAGSISGAPKKKTVEIIKKAEDYKRGFYTGIFGYFDGKNLDSAVMIRFIEKSGKELIYKSGGGITSFSDVKKEYNEMVDKVYVPII
ncbi:MAG TPA: aminodeoxychorismate synthase component I [Ignavibacteriaceae bacterium]|jgi:para-aminobenzoate synthetase component 1|nr:aminodeoxychorismate synthase component I [Ignavibacteriaceae bacterium]